MSLTVTDTGAFDTSRLADLKTHLDTTYVNQGHISGYSYLIAKNGEIAALEYSGHSAMGDESAQGFALDENSLFRIYSMTKPVVSIMFMMLVEQGKLNLSDELKKYIPAFANPQVWVDGDTEKYTTAPATRDITLHDLLTHQSGLTYDFLNEHPLDALYRRKRLTGARNEGLSLEGFCDELATLPLLFSPGTAWNYSVSLDVIGRVLEVATGKRLDKLSKEMVFDPLGMDDTDFQIVENKTDRLTHCYYLDPRKNITRCVDHPNKSIFAGDSDFCGGGGGLISSIPDYYLFCQMLRNKGELNGVRLISQETYAQMNTNQINHGGDMATESRSSFTETGSEGLGFGIGGSIVIEPENSAGPHSLGSFSWGGFASTYFWIDPEEDLTVIFMTQIMPSFSYTIRDELAQRVYGALIKP